MKAFITGITGQDGSFLAEYLLSLGYTVAGLIRRNSFNDYGNIAHISDKINLYYGDITDPISVSEAISEFRPNEIYNLAAQSFVKLSWSQPDYTSKVNGLGVLNVLDAVKNHCPDAAFYQASTSELFGLTGAAKQNEQTLFHPRSPYGVSKLYGYWITSNYRESYNMFCCNGILFNHESERRKPEFVTRKITGAVAEIVTDRTEPLRLGCLDAQRDWGYAGDYVKAMHLMLSRRDLDPDDYCIATGETHSVREFTERAFASAGISLEWDGEGLEEKAIDKKTGKTLVTVDEKYFRPAEVMYLSGDPSKAERILGWKREVSFENLIERMVSYDISLVRSK